MLSCHSMIYLSDLQLIVQASSAEECCVSGHWDKTKVGSMIAVSGIEIITRVADGK